MVERTPSRGFGWAMKRIFRFLVITVAAVAQTVAFFLVLPLFQTISAKPATDMVLRQMDTTEMQPPPPIVEEEEEEEKEEEEEPPKLEAEAPPLTLEEMALALNPALEGDGLSGSLVVKLPGTKSEDGVDEAEIFRFDDLDQKPRAIHQSEPTLSAQLRKKTPGTVNVLFIVDERGRVEKPIVQNSTDPAFEGPALSAVKQWRFEPGKRKGQAVRFRMRVPITFSKSG